jgi:c-di-GMP-binding flagellar brake protein YcgR
VLLSHAIFVSQNLRIKSAITIDISTGGISLTIPESLEVGQACAISFDVPDQEDSKQRTLISGTVASCVAKGKDGYRIGVHYSETDPVSKKLIKAAVDHYLEAH